jgi:hypothetical protein
VRTFLTIAENIAWIAGIVYSTIPAFWLVVHPFARFWREKRQDLSNAGADLASDVDCRRVDHCTLSA